MKITKVINLLPSQKQIIDINGDSVNFNIDLHINANAPFDLCLTTQDQLDNNSPMEFKSFTEDGTSVTLHTDKDVFHNHIAIFQSTKPCIVNIEIDKTILQKSVSLPQNLSSEPKPVNYKLLIGVLIVFAIFGIGLYFYFRKPVQNSYPDDSLYKSNVIPLIVRENNVSNPPQLYESQSRPSHPQYQPQPHPQSKNILKTYSPDTSPSDESVASPSSSLQSPSTVSPSTVSPSTVSPSSSSSVLTSPLSSVSPSMASSVPPSMASSVSPSMASSISSTHSSPQSTSP